MNGVNLERYRVPQPVWQGEWIELPETGARFLVKLPTKLNRQWQREMLRLISGTGVALTGESDTDAVALAQGMDVQALLSFKEQRLLAFARVCVVQGPEGFELASLTQEYWPALEKLFELAEFRAAEQMDEAERTVGES